MSNEIFEEKPEVVAVVPLEVWVRVGGDTVMCQLATMEIDADEQVPDGEDEDETSRYWARRVYDELASEFGFDNEGEFAFGFK